MSLALPVRAISIVLAMIALGLAGCATTGGGPAGTPTASRSPAAEAPAVLVQARFERLVQQLLDVEPQLTAVLDGIQATMEKPAQATFERELLQFLGGDPFKAILARQEVITTDSLLQEFTPETAAALRTAQMDRPLFTMIDGLARIAPEVAEMAALSEEGRALERVFVLIHREVLPAMVETRLILTEEQLDANEGAALAKRIEEQLQSINAQLTSLKNRARSLSTPAAPPPP